MFKTKRISKINALLRNVGKVESRRVETALVQRSFPNFKRIVVKTLQRLFAETKSLYEKWTRAVGAAKLEAYKLYFEKLGELFADMHDTAFQQEQSRDMYTYFFSAQQRTELECFAYMRVEVAHCGFDDVVRIMKVKNIVLTEPDKIPKYVVEEGKIEEAIGVDGCVLMLDRFDMLRIYLKSDANLDEWKDMHVKIGKEKCPYISKDPNDRELRTAHGNYLAYLDRISAATTGHETKAEPIISVSDWEKNRKYEELDLKSQNDRAEAAKEEAANKKKAKIQKENDRIEEKKLEREMEERKAKQKRIDSQMQATMGVSVPRP